MVPGTCFRYQERPGFWPFKEAMYVHAQVLAKDDDIVHVRVLGREDANGERQVVIGHMPLRVSNVKQPKCRVTATRAVPAGAEELIRRWSSRHREGRAGAFVVSLQDAVRLVLETIQDRPSVPGEELELEAACLKPGPDGGMDVLEVTAVARQRPRETTPRMQT